MAAAPMLMRLNVPIRFTSMTLPKAARSCGDPSRPTVRCAQPMPAQLTTTRSGAPTPAAASTAARTESASLTSVRANTPPTSSASALPRSSLRSATTTLLPAAASARTVASPRPLAPPDTIAAVALSSVAGSITRLRPFAPNGVRFDRRAMYCPEPVPSDPRQRQHELAHERAHRLGPREARPRGAQADRAVQVDPDRGAVGEHVGAR